MAKKQPTFGTSPASLFCGHIRKPLDKVAFLLCKILSKILHILFYRKGNLIKQIDQNRKIKRL